MQFFAIIFVSVFACLNLAFAEESNSDGPVRFKSMQEIKDHGSAHINCFSFGSDAGDFSELDFDLVNENIKNVKMTATVFFLNPVSFVVSQQDVVLGKNNLSLDIWDDTQYFGKNLQVHLAPNFLKKGFWNGDVHFNDSDGIEFDRSMLCEATKH